MNSNANADEEGAISVTRFHVLQGQNSVDGASFRVKVPEDCPFFEGHFPMSPVLPAIGQLYLLDSLLRRSFWTDGWLCFADSLRLLRPVLPGDVLLVRLEMPRTDEATRFEISCGGSPVSRGVIRWNRSGD